MTRIRVRPAHLKCRVSVGSFNDERSITIDAGDSTYVTFADLSEVQTDVTPNGAGDVDGRLCVRILGESHGRLLVALPRDTFSSGSRIYVDRNLVTERG